MDRFENVDMTADPGEDRTLIRELMAMSPRQRLERLVGEAQLLARIPLVGSVERERRHL